MPSNCIIGAGLSGLSFAWKSHCQGSAYRILESRTEIGGNLQSHRSGAHLYEEGPHSLLVSSHRQAAFLSSIPGLKEKTLYANNSAKKRFLRKDGQLHAVPMNPLAALSSPLLSTAGKIRLISEAWVPANLSTEDESIATFARRRLGKEVYESCINPMVSGIYAGDPDNLSVRHALPRLAAMERTHGSLTAGILHKIIAAIKAKGSGFKPQVISFIDGLQELPNTMAAALRPDALQTGVSLQKIKPIQGKWRVQWVQHPGSVHCEDFENLIITIPAHRIPQLPFPSAIQASMNCFAAIPHPTVTVNSFSFKRSCIEHPLDGFGFLQPQNERKKVLGVLFPSSLFKHRAPEDEHLISVFSNHAAPTAELLDEIKPLIGIRGPYTSHHIKTWVRAIPQYIVGYRSILESIHALENRYPGLHFVGNYRHGVALGNCMDTHLAPPHFSEHQPVI